MDWLELKPEGLFCAPGAFYIDPLQPVGHAVITHGHSDHARPGHQHVTATPETLAIMRLRMGEDQAGQTQQALPYGEVISVGNVKIWLAPAGHVLGSAQIVMEYRGERAVVSGDYKRAPDPTCVPFEVVPCDLFVTEATFGLPVFRLPDPAHEIAKLLHDVRLFPERTHVVGCYALGKCQRLIALLRESGYHAPLWLHGALLPMCSLYESFGIPLGELRSATAAKKGEMRGGIVLAPPSAIADRWARRLPEPVVCLASGWMHVRQRAKARGVELPVVISDHADWDALLETCQATGAKEIWVTHGREDALIHALSRKQIRGRALRLIGYEDDEEAAEQEAAGQDASV
ncbi:ligase-associated DNA damage response exonuclease [Gluconobacter albidus]|uniref:DNA ligase-associated DEXH box helicase n=1 Tax=Gluconobacter albidus TaxID=318683 RepID=A0ABQ5X1J8_9PROT|nr:ligase-associated DNA damage response exonuclease [Gluconobacter albidus]MBS1028951.1 ligase-associated DNA damage response exonuclease [Gluconobacter albidus]GBQ86651.1 putative exonuclease [Gluconobacter albidus NBRC 3250]GLQ69701.1 DNA ligase-associated DEXH box helicase [Gluconobacter albidus]